jgi:hypothetical protein
MEVVVAYCKLQIKQNKTKPQTANHEGSNRQIYCNQLRLNYHW